LRRVALIAGCIVLFLVAFAAAAKDTIERMVVERTLAGAFGGDASIGTLSHTDGATVLEGVSAQTADGALTVTIGRAAYTVNGDLWNVDTDGVHVSVAVDRVRATSFPAPQIPRTSSTCNVSCCM